MRSESYTFGNGNEKYPFQEVFESVVRPPTGRFFSGSFTNHRFIFSQGEHHESHQTRTSSSPASRGALRMSPDRNRMRRATPSGSARYPHLRRSIAVPDRKTPENHPAHAGTRSGAETYRLAKTTGRLRSGTEYETPTGENPVGAFFSYGTEATAARPRRCVLPRGFPQRCRDRKDAPARRANVRLTDIP